MTFRESDTTASETELAAQASQLRMPIVEIEVDHGSRKTGFSSLTGISLRNGLVLKSFVAGRLEQTRLTYLRMPQFKRG